MKRHLVAALAASFMFALGIAAHAQAPAAPKEHTMTGCLQKGADPGTYIVTNVDKVTTIGIVSSTPDLAPHVGHKIDVTGVAVPKAEAEADPKVPKANHYMKLSSIKMISPTCP